RWEATRDERFRQSLLQYNREDCETVRLLVGRLDRIRLDAASDPAIEFASKPKLIVTEVGREIHKQFERILREAQEDGLSRSILIRAGDTNEEAKPKKRRGARKGHQTFHRIIPSKVGKIVRVQPRRKCTRGHDLDLDGQNMAERTITDLVFTRNGCRKTV